MRHRTEEEEELFEAAKEYIENIHEKGLQQGLQPILHQLTRKLGRPVSPEERAVLRKRFDTLGPDRLGDVVLDLPATALAAWLADPEAR